MVITACQEYRRVHKMDQRERGRGGHDSQGQPRAREPGRCARTIDTRRRAVAGPPRAAPHASAARMAALHRWRSPAPETAALAPPARPLQPPDSRIPTARRQGMKIDTVNRSIRWPLTRIRCSSTPFSRKQKSQPQHVPTVNMMHARSAVNGDVYKLHTIM